MSSKFSRLKMFKSHFWSSIHRIYLGKISSYSRTVTDPFFFTSENSANQSYFPNTSLDLLHVSNFDADFLQMIVTGIMGIIASFRRIFFVSTTRNRVTWHTKNTFELASVRGSWLEKVNAVKLMCSSSHGETEVSCPTIDYFEFDLDVSTKN